MSLTESPSSSAHMAYSTVIAVVLAALCPVLIGAVSDAMDWPLMTVVVAFIAPACALSAALCRITEKPFRQSAIELGNATP